MFRPTPVPVQSSGTNLLDSDTHVLSLGVGFNFFDPQKFFAGRFGIDLTGQLSVVTTRKNTKAAMNDAVGDITAGGAIFSASAMLRYHFGE